MSVHITDNTLLTESEMDNRASLAIRFMLEGIHKESIPNTPMEHGNLRADVVKAVNGKHGEIRWDKNYAIYQEKIQHSNYTTPGTGPHFARNAVAATMRNAKEYLKKAGL